MTTTINRHADDGGTDDPESSNCDSNNNIVPKHVFHLTISQAYK